jgi:sterol desaturase/sphingolipid hydroxylase (fatty acid hydroxylase superfamily)
MLDTLRGLAASLDDYALPMLMIPLAFWEIARPWRPGGTPTSRRWLVNGSFYLAEYGVIFLGLAPLALVRSAAEGRAEMLPFGIVAHAVGWPAACLLALLAMDFTVYLVHRIQHHVHVLWRFHAVHHADTDLDVTTSFRHHPGERLLFIATSVFFAGVLGVPIWVASVFAFLSMVSGAFQHLNARLPARLEAVLGRVITTPRIHRVHHSMEVAHQGRNFGNVLSAWDRALGTFSAVDDATDRALAFGVEPFATQRHTGLGWAWALPFRIARPHAQPAGAARDPVGEQA